MSVLATYLVKLQMREKICGGLPKNPEVMKGWLLGRGISPDAVEGLAEGIAKELAADIEAEKSWTTFKGMADGVDFYYIEGRQVKAMLKDATRSLKEPTPGLQSAIRHGLEIDPYRISLGNKIDGFVERPVHAMTRQGPRTSLKRMDYIMRPLLEFRILIGHPKLADGKIVKALLEHCVVFEGLGASVSQGEGKFDLEAFEAM